MVRPVCLCFDFAYIEKKEKKKKKKISLSFFFQEPSRAMDTAVSLHRTKLMVLGYEKVGKTSLIECLFPFTTCRPVHHNGQQVKLEIVKKDLIVHPTKPATQQPRTEKKSLLAKFFENKTDASPGESFSSTTYHLGDGNWSCQPLRPRPPPFA